MASTTSTGGIRASSATDITRSHWGTAKLWAALMICRMPITTVLWLGSEVTSSGHRYWFQP